MTAFAMPEPLDSRQRRAVSRALLPGGSVAPQHRATTVLVAHRLRAYLWAPCLLLVVGLVDAAAFLMSESSFRWFWGATALIVLGFAGLCVYALRKARAIVVDEFGG